MPNPESIPVTWLPAHPSYGSISMSRYASSLASARADDDAYTPELLIDPRGPRTNRFKKQFHRRIAYPLKLRSHTPYPITHILDHSWADLLVHLSPKTKTVVTVHDLIPLRFPGSLSARQQKRFRSWVDHLKRADALISVSEYTKSEITSLLGIPAHKIFVVSNGVEIPDNPPPPRRISQDRFTIGSIGSLLARKNNEIFPAALQSLVKQIDRPVRMVRVGEKLPPGLKNEITAVLGPTGLDELGSISDEELSGFYSKVDCIAFPSLYEGFGLPVLEALASCTPVASSNTSSLPEVGGDIPEYFDPSDPEAFAAALKKIADGQYHEERIIAGRNRARQFSWRRTLEGFFEVYDRLLSARPESPR